MPKCSAVPSMSARHGLAVLHVAREEVGAVAGAHLGERLLALGRRPAADHDLGPLGDERLGDAAADASRAAGDHRHAVL